MKSALGLLLAAHRLRMPHYMRLVVPRAGVLAYPGYWALVESLALHAALKLVHVWNSKPWRVSFATSAKAAKSYFEAPRPLST